MLADLLSTGYSAACKQLLRGQQHSRRTEAALQCVSLLERVLQVGDLPRVGEPLDCLDRRAVTLRGENQAATHDEAVDPHRACTADAVLATDVAASENKLFA